MDKKQKRTNTEPALLSEPKSAAELAQALIDNLPADLRTAMEAMKRSSRVARLIVSDEDTYRYEKVF